MATAGRRRIYLMRHGHVDYFDPDLTDPRDAALTEEGRAQAAAAAAALAPIEFDLVVHSGLPRTRDTAAIVMDGRPPAARPEPDLEELKSGKIKVATREELAARLAFSFEAADAPGAAFLPGGEAFTAAERRSTACVTRLVTEENWRRALIVAHEGVNRIILGWACGGGLSTIDAFEQDLCCINVLDIDVTPAVKGEGLQIERILLRAVNLTPYDYFKAGLPRSSLEHLFDIDFRGVRRRGDPGA